MTIVNDDSRIVDKLEASLTDDARVVIYNRHMFIVQATGANVIKLFNVVIYSHLKVILSFFVIMLYYLGNFCKITVNYLGIFVTKHNLT